MCELLYARSPNDGNQLSPEPDLPNDVESVSIDDQGVADSDSTPSVEEPTQMFDEKQHRLSDSAGDNFG